MKPANIGEYNSRAWDSEVDSGNPWTIPVSPEEIARARKGDFTIVLTPTKPVPAAWLQPITGKSVLCLASGGGQQGPLLAAAGAHVTVFDASKKQLGRDREVAEREGLKIETVLGDMRNLRAFADGAFHLIVHPCSNLFCEDIRPVWREAFRVLKPGGSIIAGFTNPFVCTFDEELLKENRLQVRHKIPYSDLHSLTDQERAKYTDKNEPLLFGHSLEDQIGGQIEAGFAIAGFYEDVYGPKHPTPVDQYMSSFIATRAVKPKLPLT